MGGKAGAIGSIVLGVVLAVVSIAFPPASAGFFYYASVVLAAGSMIAGGAFGLAYASKASTQQNAQSQDLKIASAVTGMPIPVVFGTARITPNFQRSSPNLFTAVEVTGDSGGKGGGGGERVVTGHNYFHKWEMDFCMGEVDAVGQVYAMPGEIPMVDSVDPWVEFSGDTPLELVLEAQSEDLDEEDTTPMGGIVRLYRGSATQTRVGAGDAYSATGLNYRNVCWGLFGVSSGGKGFCLGQSAFIPTYQFMFRRRCRCIRDDGSEVTGIKVRGSSDTGHASYHLANPAAIYYEVLTNKVWGRGLSSDIIDEASFIAVSEFYEAKNIGLGLALEQSDDIGSFLEGIQGHVKTLLTWDGETYKLSSLLNIEDTHGEEGANILTLRDKDITALMIGVPLWESTMNEVRAEFTSSERGERPDTVTAQDLGNVDILGGRIVPMRIQLPAFNNWNLAYRQVARILAENAYPWRTAQWEMNRFQSHIAVGQIVRIVTTEFTDNPVTSYWLIVNIKDGGSDDESIAVQAVEDQLLSPIEGEDETPLIPETHPWERVVPVDPDDIYLVDEVTTGVDGQALAFELPEIFTTSREVGNSEYASQFPTPLVVFGLTRLRSNQLSAAVWSSTDNVVFDSLGTIGIVTHGGLLVDAMPGGFWDRSAAGFRVDINTAEFADEDLLAANLVTDPTDNLSDLGKSGKHWVICEEEIMQVGSITEVITGRYLFSNLLRGRLGTRPLSHPVGAKIYYIKTINLIDDIAKKAALLREEEEDTTNIEYFFRLRASTRGVNQSAKYFGPDFDTQIFHYGDDDTKLLGTSTKPLAPEPVSIVDGGTTVALTVRPRNTDSGPDVSTFGTAAANPVRTNPNVSYVIWQYDSALTALTEQPTEEDSSVAVVPTKVIKASVELTVTKLTGAVLFRVYSVEKNRRSNQYAEFSL